MRRQWSHAFSLAILGAACACGGKFTAADDSGGGGGRGGSGGSAGKSGSGGSMSGGAAGSGGSMSGGAAGSGGGGSGPCVVGGVCGPESSTCTDGACCPCVYTCRDGTWQMTACAGCAAPGCPVDPPAHGQTCGNCADPVGQLCTWDLCSTGAAARYSGVCNGQTWDVQAEPCTSGGCCQDDSQCGSLICVNTICKQRAPDGCWRDDNCGPDQICSGATVCPCAADCQYADSPGSCVPANLGCCRDDTNCPGGGHCVSGVCKPALEGGSCWSDHDCLGALCLGAQVCPCGVDCLAPDTEGYCNWTE
jgi:hypothetical protein